MPSHVAPAPMTEAELEARLQARLEEKGLNLPRLRPRDIDARIERADYYVFPGTTMTVCALFLINGFIVTGTSTAISAALYDRSEGEAIAYADARAKIWALEGYLLREHLTRVQTGGLFAPQEPSFW